MNKLTEKEINQALFRSLCYQGFCFNFETMQSVGFTRIVAPVIRKVYEGDDDLIQQKIESYMSTFYNTENTVGQIIHGAVVGMEASGIEDITESAQALKTGLMGPFAGLGDSIFKVGAKVIFGSLAGSMALENSIIGVVLCIAFFCFCNGPIRIWFFKQGFQQGASFITSQEGLIKGITAAVTVLGLVMVGNMIPSTVKLTTPLTFSYGEAEKTIQSILDGIFPYLLPCLATFGTYKAIGNNKITTARLVWLIIIICIIGSFFGLL